LACFFLTFPTCVFPSLPNFFIRRPLVFLPGFVWSQRVFFRVFPSLPNCLLLSAASWRNQSQMSHHRLTSPVVHGVCVMSNAGSVTLLPFWGFPPPSYFTQCSILPLTLIDCRVPSERVYMCLREPSILGVYCRPMFS